MSPRHARQLFYPLSTDTIQRSAVSPLQVLGEDNCDGAPAPVRMRVRAACVRDGRVAHSHSLDRFGPCRVR
jgi:hypothetical protein